MRLIDADELKTAFPCGEYVRTESVRATIDHIPSAQPDKDLIHLQKEQAYMQGYEDGRKTRKGKWIDSRNVSWLCSECGKWLDVLQGDVDMNFCPNCGADMREGEEE